MFRRMKSEGKTIGELLRTPLVAGKTVEVNLLGGIASFKIDGKSGQSAIDANLPESYRQLEDSAAVRTRELAALSRLVDRRLITPEEYNTLKERLIRPDIPSQAAVDDEGCIG